MHGTVEWLPGQALGNDKESWSDVLLGGLPNLYLYAANNPSESILAKRRGYATLVSYLSPPYARAGTYGVLAELKELLADADASTPTTTRSWPTWMSWWPKRLWRTRCRLAATTPWSVGRGRARARPRARHRSREPAVLVGSARLRRGAGRGGHGRLPRGVLRRRRGRAFV